jgi:hypothetical protein
LLEHSLRRSERETDKEREGGGERMRVRKRAGERGIGREREERDVEYL